MSAYVIIVLAFFVSVIAIRLTIPLAHHINAMDHPGGRKEHEQSTPFIGGFGSAAALLLFLLVAISARDLPRMPWLVMMSAAGGIFVIGFIDDLWKLDYRVRFLAQSSVAVSMALVAGVSASNLGELLPGIAIELGWFGLPFTVFATIGGINALNMIDGADGLSGTISLVSLALLAFVAATAEEQFYFQVILVMLGGTLGFLFFNVRCCRWTRARVFLGDNGSMLHGFMFAWLFLGLSQGEDPAMTPVTALFLFAVPLYDTVAVMIRRIWMRRSPFHADRHHLHHLLQRAGARVTDAVFAIAFLHLLLGVIGLMGFYWGTPEWVMFFGFLAGFSAYAIALARPWRFVPLLRRALLVTGFTLVNCRGVYIGRFNTAQVEDVVAWFEAALGERCPYSIYSQPLPTEPNAPLYAFVDTHDEQEAVQTIRQLQQAKPERLDLNIRQYLSRNALNGQRVRDKVVPDERRVADRRACYPRELIRAFEPGTAATVVTA